MGEARRAKYAVLRADRISEYAEECKIDREHADRRLAAWDRATKLHHCSKRCPRCGKYELMINSTDYEYTNNEEWVECMDCGFTDDISKKYEFLLHWAMWDSIAAEADIYREEGFPNNWTENALKSTERLGKWIQEVEEAQ
jgi:hypothetical protein